jgi:hypothetical protein
VISLLNYRDQHAADESQRTADAAATIAAERHDAEQVSVWLDYNTNDLLVENLSPGPVYNVMLRLEALVGNSDKPHQIFLWLGNVPPCSIGPTDSLLAARKYEMTIALAKTMPSLTIIGNQVSMSFSDRNGPWWIYSDHSQLRQVTQREGDGPNFDGFVSASFKSASGCS